MTPFLRYEQEVFLCFMSFFFPAQTSRRVRIFDVILANANAKRSKALFLVVFC